MIAAHPKLRNEYSVREALRISSERLRAAVLSMQGARVGAKTRVGARLVIHHPRSLTLGTRCHVEHDVFIKSGQRSSVVIGDHVFIGRGVELDVTTSLHIGNHVLIAPGCFLTDHTHRHARSMRIDQQGCNEAAVRIEDDVWLGTGVVVLAGVVIGHGAVVGAGSVVKSSVPPWAIVAGAPARQVGERR